MNTEARLEINRLTEEAILEVMRSKKIKPEVKAEIGLKYEKMASSIELGKVNTAVHAAGLYTPMKREQIAEKMIPMAIKVMTPSEIEIAPGDKVREMYAKLNEAKQENAGLREELIKELQEKNKLSNELADIKDDIAVKEQPALTELQIKEYELKRQAVK